MPEANKSKWGVKRTCLKCNAKFYDLNKNPIVCPTCHQEFSPQDFIQNSLLGKMKRNKKEENEIDDLSDKLSDEDDILDEELSEDDDLTVMEDTSEISDDSHDMAEVIGNIDKNPLSE